MPPIHIQPTSRALHRVFVAPNFQLHRPHIIPFLHLHPTRTLINQSRGKKRFEKDTSRHLITDDYILDTAITAPFVNLVHESGRFETDIPLRRALLSYDRKTHYLVQVSSGEQPKEEEEEDEEEESEKREGIEDYINAPSSIPTCRIIDKIELRQKHAAKLESKRRQAKGIAVKMIELNWAIAPGDFAHKMKQLRNFLANGKRVEVIFGSKSGKNKRQASAEEAQKLLSEVRGILEESDARQIREEGVVGGTMAILSQGKHFDNPKPTKKDKKERRDEESETREVEQEDEKGKKSKEIEAKRFAAASKPLDEGVDALLARAAEEKRLKRRSQP